jgi:flagellar protein FlbT
MGLKITLKPSERMIIGGAVVANGNGKSEFLVENPVPILREKDILGEHDADTPCKRIYFIIQLMYIDERKLAEHHNAYWSLVREVLAAAPSMLPIIDQISEAILGGAYYRALKLAKHLLGYEQEIMNNVRKPAANL